MSYFIICAYFILQPKINVTLENEIPRHSFWFLRGKNHIDQISSVYCVLKET